MSPKKIRPVNLSAAAIANMKKDANRMVSFCLSCLKDLMLDEPPSVNKISAYCEALYINQKLADSLEKLEDERPIIADEKSGKDKYVLDIEDIFMLEVLVNAKASFSMTFPFITGGCSLEVH